MSDKPVHLEPVKTDRGFAHLPPIIDEYGTSVHVYESSAASGAYVWLMLTGGDRQDDDCNPSVTAHLTLSELVKLGEQIEWMKQNHYQGEWEDTPKKSLWSRFVAQLRGSGDED